MRMAGSRDMGERVDRGMGILPMTGRVPGSGAGLHACRPFPLRSGGFTTRPPDWRAPGHKRVGYEPTPTGNGALGRMPKEYPR